MGKGLDTIIDAGLDTKSGDGSQAADFGGDLSDDEGMDLNAQISDSDSEAKIRSKGARGFLAGAGALTAGVAGVGAAMPNEMHTPHHSESYAYTEVSAEHSERMAQFNQDKPFEQGDFIITPQTNESPLQDASIGSSAETIESGGSGSIREISEETQGLLGAVADGIKGRREQQEEITHAIEAGAEQTGPEPALPLSDGEPVHDGETGVDLTDERFQGYERLEDVPPEILDEIRSNDELGEKSEMPADNESATLEQPEPDGDK